MGTMTGFLNRHRVGMQADLVERNPNMDGMMAGSTHWKCRLRAGNRRMTVYFSQGPAISREPTAEGVLNCLASDAASVDGARSFEEWAADLGMDADSRKAEATFRTVERQAANLKRLLGETAYRALLFDTERL